MKLLYRKGATGLPANRKKNGRDVPCPNCGKLFYVRPCEEGLIKSCSVACRSILRWGGTRKESKPCTICGKTIPGYISDKRKVCSKKCHSAYKSIHLSGEKSVLWRGGKTAPYDRRWKKRRDEAKQRDGYQCQRCGLKPKRLEVHHIIPYRYSQDHSLSNLITLCRSCHSSEELKVNKAAAAGLKMRWPSK